MTLRTFPTRRPEGRAARRRFIPTCEVLEDRTVPNAAAFFTDLSIAQQERAALNYLRGLPRTAQVASQLATIAFNDAAVEQRLYQEAGALQGQLGPALNAELSNFQQQEAQVLSSLAQTVQAYYAAIPNFFASGNMAGVQVLVNAIHAVQMQEAAVVNYFNAQEAAAVSSISQANSFYLTAMAQAATALQQDLATPGAFPTPPLTKSAATPTNHPTTSGSTSTGTNKSADPTLITLTLNPLNINLLGLEVQTNQITVTVSAQPGNGELLGNLLTSVANLLNLQGVNNALNTVLGSVVGLLNSASLNVSGVATNGPLNTSSEPAGTVTPVLDAFIAPVHLNLLGALVDTSPIHLTIKAQSGPGLILGNVVTDLADLLNSAKPRALNVNQINNALTNLLTELGAAAPNIGSSPTTTPTTPSGTTQVLNLTVPPINLNLLGLVLKTSQIQVNADAQFGTSNLLGNLLTDLLQTLNATPQDLATLNNNLNALLGKVVGILNAASLTLPANALGSLSQVLQTLALPNLINSTGTASAPILNLAIASTDGTTPPVDVNLLGLVVTTSNIQAQLIAQTGNGQVLGNLLYNVANLLNPGSSLSLLSILTDLGI